MATEDELRQRILDAAAELFAERGYGGTKLAMVAERAHVPARTVKRLTGGRTQLFAEVMAAKVTSEAAERLASAAAEPAAEPPLSVLLNAVAEIFAAPERSWNVLELEALTRAHEDRDVRALEADRIQRRWANTKKVTEQTRRAGGIDDQVDDDAFVHFALALSVGLAMVAPVVERQPSQANWNALMSRLGASIAPAEFALLFDAHGVGGYARGVELREPAPCVAQQRCKVLLSRHRGLVRDNLANTLNGFVQEVCPVSRPLKKESQRMAKAKAS